MRQRPLHKGAQRSRETSIEQQKKNISRNNYSDANFFKRSDYIFWEPCLFTVFFIFCAVRLFSARFNYISDCDETFNYWEPTHYLQYGFGFQTWEYSPVYALRSYLYLSLHLHIGKIASYIVHANDKVAVFYAIRACLAIFCATCETLFYSSILKAFGKRVGMFTLFFLCFSNGMFHSSTAYLPSSFSMYLTLLVVYAWINQFYFLGVFLGVISVIWGWPYVAFLYLPFAIDCFYFKGYSYSLLYGISSSIIVILPEILVNYYFYGIITLPSVNIVNYNIFGGGGGAGSSLYGTEPWSFYFINCFLNFNILFCLSFVSILVLCISYFILTRKERDQQTLKPFLYLLPMYLWFFVMLIQPHKEERFLYPIYPFFCLSGAYSLKGLLDIIEYVIFKISFKGYLYSLNKFLISSFLFTFFIISLSRFMSIYINYSAPLSLYQELFYQGLDDNNCSKADGCNLCIGKEWFRFPTSYYIPSSDIHVGFFKTSFKGQLPKAFQSHNGTWIIPSDMNDRNLEEKSRYVELDNCDYVIDLTLKEQQEHDFTKDQEWKIIFNYSFLNSGRSASLYRAFYIPFLTPKHVEYASYALFKKLKQ